MSSLPQTGSAPQQLRCPSLVLGAPGRSRARLPSLAAREPPTPLPRPLTWRRGVSPRFLDPGRAVLRVLRFDRGGVEGFCKRPRGGVRVPGTVARQQQVPGGAHGRPVGAAPRRGQRQLLGGFLVGHEGFHAERQAGHLDFVVLLGAGRRALLVGGENLLRLGRRSHHGSGGRLERGRPGSCAAPLPGPARRLRE